MGPLLTQNGSKGEHQVQKQERKLLRTLYMYEYLSLFPTNSKRLPVSCLWKFSSISPSMPAQRQRTTKDNDGSPPQSSSHSSIYTHFFLLFFLNASLILQKITTHIAQIAQTTAALTRLKAVWNNRGIFLSSKIRLMRSLVNPSSRMLVNHGPSQKSSKEEYKPWK